MSSRQRIMFTFVFLGAVGLGSLFAAVEAPVFSPEGIWLGTLSVPGAKLRVVFNIVKQPDGTLKATMDSLDQGAKGIPVDEVKVEGNRLQLAVNRVQGSYDGTYDPTTGEIAGQWTQSVSFPLKLKRVDKAPEATTVNHPQNPKPPYPYLEEQVTYKDKATGITFAGTLTEPKEGRPFPAVLLITGSGSQDRDETVAGHKPFWIIADDLTRAGIAVLRVDDRGVGGTTGSPESATSEDLAGDVLTGVEYLKGRPDIDPRRIGLIGHSEGGLIAPMAAAKSPDVAFIVLLAGTGVTGERILLEQGELMAKAEGASPETIAKTTDFQKQAFEITKANKDPKASEAKLRPLLSAAYETLSEDEKKAAGSRETWVNNQIKALNSPWLRFFLTYDPKPTLEKVRCPVLALGGSLDLQVPAEENLKTIGEALKAGGNTRFQVQLLPGLNHLFQTAKTGALSEYAKSEETFSPSALKVMRDWILSVTGLKK